MCSVRSPCNCTVGLSVTSDSSSGSENGNFLAACRVGGCVVIAVCGCERLSVSVSSVFVVTVLVCDSRGDTEEASGVGVLGFDADEHVDDGEL